MGGPGSGTYYRWNKKATTKELIQIDVRQWNQRLSRPGFSFSGSWSKGETERFRVSIEGAGGSLMLQYSLESLWHPPKKGEAVVRLAFTPCNFGGERPWFLCPNTSCGRRIAKLYFGSMGFLCRNCYQLAYPSQQWAPEDRALYEIDKIHARLGMADGLPDSPLPPRPKRMRNKTYALLEKKRQKSLEQLEAAGLRLLRRSEAVRKRGGNG